MEGGKAGVICGTSRNRRTLIKHSFCNY